MNILVRPYPCSQGWKLYEAYFSSTKAKAHKAALKAYRDHVARCEKCRARFDEFSAAARCAEMPEMED